MRQPNYCHCIHCDYTFNADVASTSKAPIPRHCPKCRKRVVHTENGSVPAVRKATEEEITAYNQDMRKTLERMDFVY